MYNTHFKYVSVQCREAVVWDSHARLVVVEGQYSGSCLSICRVGDLSVVRLWSPAERPALEVVRSTGGKTTGLVSRPESFPFHARLKPDLSTALRNSFIRLMNILYF